MADRKKPGAAFWATAISVVALLLPVLYVASFGPVVWQIDSGRLPPRWQSAACWVYGPLVNCAADSQHPFAKGLYRWAALGCDRRFALYTLWMMQPFEYE